MSLFEFVLWCCAVLCCVGLTSKVQPQALTCAGVWEAAGGSRRFDDGMEGQLPANYIRRFGGWN